MIYSQRIFWHIVQNIGFEQNLQINCHLNMIDILI